MTLTPIPRPSLARRLAPPLFAATVVAMVACSDRPPAVAGPLAPAATAAAAAPELPFAVLPDGGRLLLELAITPEEIANGLMFRPELAPDRAMLFQFEEARVPAFWMKNTLIPLDLIFLDDGGLVVDIIGDVKPCAADPCPQYIPRSPARAVLEIAAGGVVRHRLEIGQPIEFHNVEGYPVPPAEAGLPG